MGCEGDPDSEGIPQDATAVFLLERLRDLKRGRGSCLLIGGSPKAGKSRVLDRLTSRAELHRIRTVSLRCRPHSFGFGASVLSAISIWARSAPQLVAFHPRTSRVKLFAVESAGNDVEAAHAEVSPLDKSSEQRPEPLVLALDDVHHADDISLALLRSIALLVEKFPLLVLATHLPLNSLNEPARASLEQFAGAATQRLQIGDSDGLAGANGHAAGHDLLSTGHAPNGFNGMAESSAVSAHRAGANYFEQKDTTKWVARLENGERRVLEIAAVFGKSFNPRQLIMVVDLDEAEAERHLSALDARGIIKHNENGKDYCFSDGALRDYLYRQISSARRIGIHKRIARLLDALHPYDPAFEAAAIAHHYVEGIDESVAERAAVFTRIASQSAEQRGDFAAAERIFDAALLAMESLGTGRDDRWCDLLIGLGGAQRRLGKYRDAQTSLGRAAEFASNADDNLRLAAAVMRMPQCQWPLLGGCAGPAIEYARKALSGLSPVDSLRAMLLARIGFETAFAGDLEQGKRSIAEAMRVARESGDRHAMAQVLSVYDRALTHPDDIRERLSNAVEVVALAGQTGDGDLLHQGTIIKIRCLLELGEFVHAEAETNSLLRRAASGGGMLVQASALLLRSLRAFREGRLCEAEDIGESFRALTAVSQMPDADDFYWPAMFVCFAERGRLAELEPLARETVNRHPTVGVSRALLAWLYLEMGRAGDARFHFDRLALAGFRSFANQGTYLSCLAALAMVASALGDRSRCQQLFEVLLPYASRAVVMGLAVSFGSAERYLGLLAAALDRPAEAIERLERAVEFNRRVGGRPWSAYASCELARLLAEQGGTGERARGAKLRAEVIEEARDLAMPRLGAMAQRIEVKAAPQISLARNTGLHEPEESGTQASVSGASGRMAATDSHRMLAMFLREADFWTLRYGDETIRVKHSKGLELMSVLLKNPGRQFHAVELCGILDGSPTQADANLSGNRSDPMLDGKARSSYRERLRELSADIEDARNLNDGELVAKLEEEKSFVTRELARAVGLGGFDRRMASRAERARTRVTNAIRSTLHKISDNHEELGHYLARTVKTGTFCRYDPDRGPPVSWVL